MDKVKDGWTIGEGRVNQRAKNGLATRRMAVFSQKKNAAHQHADEDGY
jgi:hypothetical protein